jgi:hypothetical protein
MSPVLGLGDLKGIIPLVFGLCPPTGIPASRSMLTGGSILYRLQQATPYLEELPVGEGGIVEAR